MPPKKGAKGGKGGKKKKPPKSQVSCVIKYIVFGFNVFFWLVGGLILAAGIWAWTQKTTFENFSKITGTNLFDPVLFVIVIGAVIFVVGFFGCIGALRENTKLLNMYSVLIGIYLVFELACCILLFTGRGWYITFVGCTFLVIVIVVALSFSFKDWFSVFVGVIFFIQLMWAVLLLIQRVWLKKQIEKQLKRMIVKYRDDPDLQNMIDWMQGDWLKCCGMEGPDDWEMNEYFNCSSPSREACGVPFSCCVEDKDAVIVNTQCGYDTRDSSITPNQKDVIYTDGCVDAGDKWLNNNLVPVAAVLLAVALVQILGICFAQNLRSDILAQKSRW